MQRGKSRSQLSKNSSLNLNRFCVIAFFLNRQWKSLPSWNPSAHVLLLIYFTYNDTVFEEQQKGALAVFLRYNMLNIKIITFRNASLVLDIVTWFPFDKHNCASGVTDLVPIGKCEFNETHYQLQHFRINKTVVPNYIPGCKLRISTSIQEPYVYYNRRARTFSGLEVTIVKSIAKKMGMITDFVLIPEVRSNRVVNNITGIYSLLLQRYCRLMEISIMIIGVKQEQ